MTNLEYRRLESQARRIRPDGLPAAQPMPLVADGWGNELSVPCAGILIGLTFAVVVGLVCGIFGR